MWFLQNETMITVDKARQLATKKVDELGKEANVPLSILKDDIEDFEYGWMFFYQSKEYLDTGNPGKMVGGNAPIIVDKYNALVHITGTSRDENFYIEKYCQLRETPEKFQEEIR